MNDFIVLISNEDFLYFCDRIFFRAGCNSLPAVIVRDSFTGLIWCNYKTDSQSLDERRKMAGRITCTYWHSPEVSLFQKHITISIEAKEGVTTGISATDQIHTIRAAVYDTAKPDDLAHTGHIFPLAYQIFSFNSPFSGFSNGPTDGFVSERFFPK